ncbi:NAD kinase [Corynebacterium doosanense]|uniref:NAD kinase n=1 Tax=Corynebacterium doosanense CAU 212 = DSM 45436 TaxID=558173 RepID=A0A097IFW2_9CORY|nr:NAD kinase [Corynebacterium doosanense]AIT61024.1 inorganic polyphosphate kinase [Corynebacterium doosanense CAU 212 = DSM 45436]
MSEQRQILLVPHTGRESNIVAAARTAELAAAAGISVRVLFPQNPDALDAHPQLADLPRVKHGPEAARDCELVLVLGGDGTFLRAADIARAQDVPVLGINLGHVGFLAEWEADSLDQAIQYVIDREYRVVDRMTIDAVILNDRSEEIGRGWALNEVSVENVNRRGVLDAILEVDQRPVSSFGCDGVLIATPTGSTAYSFSAGGPVLWPQLDAILVVPNNAHALFTKPLIVAPSSRVAVESLATTSAAVAVMDGHRVVDMPPGSRIEVVRGERPVRWVRLDDRPFTDRLVSKLRLPVSGWRGPAPI